MERFEGYFHQSDLKAYLKCPRSFYYNRVLDLDKERVSMANLCGRAGHSTVEMAHRKGLWNYNNLFEPFLTALDAEVQSVQRRGMEVHGKLDEDRYKAMLAGYADKAWNREAEVWGLEREFYFEIKPSKTTYGFAGRFDQVLKIRTELLRADFPDLLKSFHKPHVILHRDVKFGRRRETSKFELALNVQIDVYAYALKHGVVAPPPEPGEEDQLQRATRLASDIEGCFKPWDLIPDFHSIYFVEDHIPPAKSEGNYLKDEEGQHIPCDLVSEPCLLGVRNTPCKGKRTYCGKNPLIKPAMYFTTRPEARLAAIPAELGRACASIRMGHYPRQLGELCFSYCQYRSVCEAEVLAETEEREAA